ncbi:hypothetical protein TNCV_843761 [Trichonephila clavipes]|nr:hypothetical protein TNCV_843761 [Trichonephila clavipes]
MTPVKKTVIEYTTQMTPLSMVPGRSDMDDGKANNKCFQTLYVHCMSAYDYSVNDIYNDYSNRPSPTPSDKHPQHDNVSPWFEALSHIIAHSSAVRIHLTMIAH